jgi:hypothetical protein
MSNVVGFLEALSLDARRLSESEYVQAVEAADLDATTRQALIERDSVALNLALDTRATVVAFIMPAEDEPDSDTPDTPDPDQEPMERENEPHSNARAA